MSISLRPSGAGLGLSILFGHRRGAYTGANYSRDGVFKSAHEGTLLLDEIETLAPGLQVKILRALDNGEIFPIGEDKPDIVNVRIISATKIPLHFLVKRGSMRADFFHRVGGAEIKIPSLEQRPSDIQILAKYFLRKIDESFEFSDGAIRKLETHRYTGNVRELQLVVRLAVALSQNPTIDAHHIVFSGKLEPSNERRRLVEALRRHKWNRTAAARELGVHRNTLARKLVKLEIELD